MHEPQRNKRTPLSIFISYAHKDVLLCQQLEAHLSLLRRQGWIADWHDRQILAGDEWARDIDQHLETASIILLLISADFLASDYCYQTEMQRALERHRKGSAWVIPVILRPVDWHRAPFAHLQYLPHGGKPIAEWENQDAAFADVVAGIRRAIEGLTQIPADTPTSSLPRLWNVPYRHNPFFTGRENLLTLLHTELTTIKPSNLSQPQAITGLGGIGKTQVAIEYAYRYYDQYHTVLWVNATTRETLISDFVALASLLNLPEKDNPDQSISIVAVKRWLTSHDKWLLILDNADDLEAVHEFLPNGGNGHILLTTRVQFVGAIAHSIEVEKMDKQEGTLFLLRRAKILPPDAPLDQIPDIDRAKAEMIVVRMDGLPLALDQAGAYIEETECSISAYLDWYQRREAVLLKQRGGAHLDHPEPVATTWSLSFERVERLNEIAADLLRFCAFLSPDAIPEEMIVKGAVELGPILQSLATNQLLLDEAIRILRRFSLVHRDKDDRTLSLHRLVQTVLKAGLSEDEQRKWAERTVRAINRAFPDHVIAATWPHYQRYLPHAEACANLISQYNFTFSEATRLLGEAASYSFAQKELFYQQALSIREQVLGPDHPDTAASLDTLARFYEAQGNYEQASSLYERISAIKEKMLGPDPLDSSPSFNNLTVMPLPAAAVIIDTRQSSDHDRLIQNLASELYELSTEMELNDVHRWRFLSRYMDFFKLVQVGADEPTEEESSFILTRIPDQMLSLHGERALVEELCIGVDRVRNNRINAIMDLDQNGKWYSQSGTAVRVFFLGDAENPVSLVNAATYARWLKSYYSRIERPGLQRMLSTTLICMNANPGHTHDTLAQYLTQVPSLVSALDAILLLPTYNHDGEYTSQDERSYEVELILYTLLLLSPGSLAVGDQLLCGSGYIEEHFTESTIPPLYTIGLSSLEYSNRLGQRWLDYSLVAKMIKNMLEIGEVTQAYQQEQIRKEVQDASRSWLSTVYEVIPSAFTTTIPGLQALNEMQRYLATSSFRQKGPSSTIQALQDFSQHISHLYTGSGTTLESSLESSWQLPPRESQLYQKILTVRFQATRFLASLSHEMRGILPRAFLQISELEKAITEIRQVAENSPDLQQYSNMFKLQADQEQKRLQEISTFPWWSLGRRLRQQWEDSTHQLKGVAYYHLEQVRTVIAARVTLALLEEAGLYNPHKQRSLYHERLILLNHAMRVTVYQAALLQERATERMKFSLSKAQDGISQRTTKPGISRRDILNWEQVIGSFERLYRKFEATPVSLPLLMEVLIRLLGTQEPSVLIQEYLHQAEVLEKENQHILSTIVSSVLLLADIADLLPADLEQLLRQCDELMAPTASQSLGLKSNLLKLQRLITESVLLPKSQLLGQERLLAPILAAWVNDQYSNDSLLTQTLDRRDVLAHIGENRIKPDEVVNYLRVQNRLLELHIGATDEGRSYLLLSPGRASDEFLKELRLRQPLPINAVHFPDIEKLIYLRIHRTEI